MAYQILIPFLAYELITIFGVGIYLAKKGNNNDVEGFTLAGRTFGLALMFSTKEINAIDAEVEKAVMASVKFAKESPYPDISEAYKDVFISDELI